MNVNMFEIIGIEGDPLYEQLQQMSEEYPVQVEGFIVSKDKYYEVLNDEVHVGFKDLKSCYQFLSNIVVTGVGVNKAFRETLLSISL